MYSRDSYQLLYSEVALYLEKLFHEPQNRVCAITARIVNHGWIPLQVRHVATVRTRAWAVTPTQQIVDGRVGQPSYPESQRGRSSGT